MSDERVRELERRWKETGTVEDESAYLLERLRIGDLPQEMLNLAAYCGHPAALNAIKEDITIAISQCEIWVAGLTHWNKSITFRAAIAAILHVIDYYPDNLTPKKLLNVAIAKFKKSKKVAIKKLLRASIAMDSISSVSEFSNKDCTRTYISQAVAFAVLSILLTTKRHVSDREIKKTAIDAIIKVVDAERVYNEIDNGFITIREAISKSLIPWALGYSDPLSELG